MNDDGMKIVSFEHCATCTHVLKKEDEEPCYECLTNATNLNSHKPVNWKEKRDV